MRPAGAVLLNSALIGSAALMMLRVAMHNIADYDLCFFNKFIIVIIVYGSRRSIHKDHYSSAQDKLRAAKLASTMIHQKVGTSVIAS